MKIRISIITLVAGLFSTQVSAQQTYKNEPLILANTEKADIAFGKNWYLNRWRISAQIAHDTLNVKLYGKSERIAFRTDQDSISFEMKAGETKSFYVKMKNAEAAHTIISTSPYQWDKVDYAESRKRKDLKFYYENAKTSYSDSLRKEYPLEKVIKNDRNDMQRILSILNWTHHQWKHDGNKSPKKNDAISILDEVKAGGRFPCFAYAIVLRDQLTAYGFKARTIYLKTKDAETRKGSPGHVATEVFLNDQKKWIFIDGQFNVMPTLNGKPLNAVEFQQALSNNYDQVVLTSKDKVEKRDYVDFVYDYLYYFDTALDNRNIPANESFKLEGKTSLMLVPLGAPHLQRISFWDSKVNYCVYTNSVKDFYAQPQ
jgi:hypothetical protein